MHMIKSKNKYYIFVLYNSKIYVNLLPKHFKFKPKMLSNNSDDDTFNNICNYINDCIYMLECCGNMFERYDNTIYNKYGIAFIVVKVSDITKAWADAYHIILNNEIFIKYLSTMCRINIEDDDLTIDLALFDLLNEYVINNKI